MEENEKNKLEAMDLADKIYRVVIDPSFIKSVPDPDIRYKVVSGKYPNFAQAYPIVIRYLARELKYNRKAFKKFLDKLEKDPGKGMQGFMERQADYARFLYIADHEGKHPNMRYANELWRMEYDNMSKWHKKLLEEEKQAKNEFEEEKEKNLEIKKQELLDFMNSFDNEVEFEPMDDFHEDAERMKFGIPLKNPNPADIDTSKLSKEEICLVIRGMKTHENDLLGELNTNHSAIKNMEETIQDVYGEKINETLSLPIQPDSSILEIVDLSTIEKEDLCSFMEKTKGYISELKTTIVSSKIAIERIASKYDAAMLIKQEKEKKEQFISEEDKKEINEWLQGTSANINKKKKKK